MKVGFILEHDSDKVTNLNLANAIVLACKEYEVGTLDAKVVAKAILLEMESDGE